MKEKIKHKKTKKGISKVIGWTIFCLGAVALISSVFYNSQISAFIGLGLTFWGIILTYIQTEEYIKARILDATTQPLLKTLNQIIDELGYQGKAVYLPPKYLKDPESNIAYIPKQKSGTLPRPLQILEQPNKIFVENPNGLLITPPGSKLAQLFEENLETSFIKVDLQYLEQNMPKVLIEDLEIAQNLEIETRNNVVRVKIEGIANTNLIKAAKELPKIWNSIGCPISSAIACALAKTSGKPVIIINQKTEDKSRVIEVEYRLLTERE